MSEGLLITFICFILALFATYLLTDAYFNIKGTTLKDHLNKRFKKDGEE